MDNTYAYIQGKIVSNTYSFEITQNGTYMLEGIYESMNITIAEGIRAMVYDTSQAAMRTITIKAGAHCTYLYYDVANIPLLMDHIYVQRDGILTIIYAGKYSTNVKRSVDIYMQDTGAQVICYLLCTVYGNAYGIFDTKQHHQAPHTTSMLEVRKILYETSQALYNGLVHIAQHASGSNASQQDKTLLMSHSARAQSIPALEVCTPDVHCAHGSALGTFDSDHLWYLQSRGICIDKAHTILLYAFFDSVLQSMPLYIRQEICTILDIQGIE